MIGLFLFALYPSRVLLAEIIHGGLQPLPRLGGQGKELLPGQEQEIFHFHQYPVADQRIFGEIFVQVLYLMAVAPVDWEMAVSEFNSM